MTCDHFYVGRRFISVYKGKEEIVFERANFQKWLVKQGKVRNIDLVANFYWYWEQVNPEVIEYDVMEYVRRNPQEILTNDKTQTQCLKSSSPTSKS